MLITTSVSLEIIAVLVFASLEEIVFAPPFFLIFKGQQRVSI